MALNWMDPGPDERAVAAEFLQSEEAREIRPKCIEAPLLDAVPPESMAQKKFHASLAALEATLPAVLGLQKTPVKTSKGWDDLTESLLAAERDYEDQGKDMWRRIWYGLGDKAEFATPWIEIIPNEYGLAVVKTGVAVILKLAKKSLEKRKKVLQAFEEIQKAMTSAHPLKGSFRSHADVAVALDELQKAIIDSVNDILVLTAKEEHSWRNLKNNLIQRTKYRDIDLVLQLLSEKTQGLKDALETAHYQSIESIDIKTTYTAIGTATVLRGVSQLEEKVDLQREEIYSVSVAARKQNALLSERIDSLRALFEAQLIEKAEISGAHLASAGEAPPSDLGAWFIEKVEDMLIANKRDTEIQDYTRRDQSSISRHRRGAVINELQFCEALADPPLHEDEELDIESLAAQPENDWSSVTRYSGDFDSKTQSQVKSILQRGRFLGWMKSKYPDLILVLADLPTSGLENITAVSVFCATLITSLTNLRREDLVLHFFCGLHVDRHDPSPGPRGLVRSLIMQLFGHLTRAGTADLGFIYDREYVRDIEDQHLGALCQTLRELLWQCEPGTHVYCIIDSITLFERAVWSRDLTKVARCLRDCVDDGEMPAVLKVMLTSSALCTPELKKSLTVGDSDTERVLYLSAEDSFVEGNFGNQTERQLEQLSVAPRPQRWQHTSRRYKQRYENEG